VDCKLIAHIDFIRLITLTHRTTGLQKCFIELISFYRFIYLHVVTMLNCLYITFICVSNTMNIYSLSQTSGLWTLNKLNLPHVSSCADGLIVQDLRSWRQERNKRLITPSHQTKSGPKYSHTSVKNILLTQFHV